MEPGTITYTQWLNHGGTLEADLTVMKLPRNHSSDENEFLVVATDSAHRHVESRMQRFIRGLGEDPATQGKRFAATVCDMSSGLAQLNLQGPDSRRILAAATAAGSNNGSLFTCADVSDEAFPFRACRELSIGFAPVLASRITYVGELGYELFVDAAQVLKFTDREQKHAYFFSISRSLSIPRNHLVLIHEYRRSPFLLNSSIPP